MLPLPERHQQRIGRGDTVGGSGLKLFTVHCSLFTAMSDEYKCLGCKCTFEGGCEYERETAQAFKNRQRLVIPPRYCGVPPVSMRTSNPEAAKAHALRRRRERLEAMGFTVRERK